MNNDRIAEIYEGEHGSIEVQRNARERVHWICRHVRGNDVLDIGCGQGIIGLLLGRDGKQVIGVDRDSKAIADAQRRLRQEESDVSERVRFVCADASKLDFQDMSFDSLILGDVIERQIDPVPLLREAARLTRPKGAIVLTTPYGISGQMDRSGATQLTALIELLSARFRIAALELIDGHIGVVASPSPRPAQTSEVWRRALQLSEQVMAAVATESGVVAQQAREQLAATLRRVEELDRTMSVAEARLEEMEQDADLLTEALREREQLLVSVQGEQHALLDAYSAAKHGVIALRRRLAAIEQEGENGIAVAAELPVAPAPVDGGYGAAQQPDPELERLHPEVARLEAELAQAVQERDAAQHEADAAASEIAVLQQEVGKAHAQAEAATEATVALERVLERANSEVARLTQQVAVVETQPAKPRRSSKR